MYFHHLDETFVPLQVLGVYEPHASYIYARPQRDDVNELPCNVQCNLNAIYILQLRNFLTSYNKLSEICFVDCITDFTTREVRPKEEKCALNCMEKYLKMNQRVSQRFQEFQITANENILAAKRQG